MAGGLEQTQGDLVDKIKNLPPLSSPLIPSRGAQEAPAAPGAPAAPAAPTAAPGAPAVPAAPTVQAAPRETRPAAEYAAMPSEEYWKTSKENLGRGLSDYASGLSQMVEHPIETAKAVGSLGVDLAKGLGSKAIDAAGDVIGTGPLLDPETKAQREAVADSAFEHFNYLTDKDEFWKRLAEDPLSIALDASLFAPAIGAAGRAAGLGKAATAAQKVASLGDPLNVAVQGAKLATKGVTRPVGAVAAYPGAVAAGVPINALRVAGQTGRSADPAARQAFKSVMTGTMEPRDVARATVDAMQEKTRAVSNYYASKKRSLTTQPLPMGDIRRALDDAMLAANRYGTRGGTAVVDVLNRMDAKIRAYENHPNPAARTAVELDLLKRDLRDMADELKPSERGAVSSIPNSVRDTISRVDSTYAQMMDYWQDWMRQMRDLQSTLGTGDRVSETARLARLMSTMKSGDKMNLLKQLKDTPSGKYLAEMIAGLAFRDIMPPAYQGFGLGLLGTALTGGPHGLAAVAAASPRLAGMTQYGLGRVEGAVNAIPKSPPGVSQALYQIGQQNAAGGRVERKTGGRVGVDHEKLADGLVRAAEVAKKSISKGTEALLDLPDNHIASALQKANEAL